MKRKYNDAKPFVSVDTLLDLFQEVGIAVVCKRPRLKTRVTVARRTAIDGELAERNYDLIGSAMLRSD